MIILKEEVASETGQKDREQEVLKGVIRQKIFWKMSKKKPLCNRKRVEPRSMIGGCKMLCLRGSDSQ